MFSFCFFEQRGIIKCVLDGEANRFQINASDIQLKVYLCLQLLLDIILILCHNVFGTTAMSSSRGFLMSGIHLSLTICCITLQIVIFYYIILYYIILYYIILFYIILYYIILYYIEWVRHFPLNTA